jgi:hypothetical protein
MTNFNRMQMSRAMMRGRRRVQSQQAQRLQSDINRTIINKNLNSNSLKKNKKKIYNDCMCCSIQ